MKFLGPPLLGVFVYLGILRLISPHQPVFDHWLETSYDNIGAAAVGVVLCVGLWWKSWRGESTKGDGSRVLEAMDDD